MKKCKAPGWDVRTASTPPAQALAFGSTGINSSFSGGGGGVTAEP